MFPRVLTLELMRQIAFSQYMLGTGKSSDSAMSAMTISIQLGLMSFVMTV